MNPKIHIASVSNEELVRLVNEHRDNAGKAQRLQDTPAKAERYADVQNGWADIYQELLDRRRGLIAQAHHHSM